MDDLSKYSIQDPLIASVVSMRNRKWGKECDKLQQCSRKDSGRNRHAKQYFYSGKDEGFAEAV